MPRSRCHAGSSAGTGSRHIARLWRSGHAARLHKSGPESAELVCVCAAFDGSWAESGQLRHASDRSHSNLKIILRDIYRDRLLWAGAGQCGGAKLGHGELGGTHRVCQCRPKFGTESWGANFGPESADFGPASAKCGGSTPPRGVCVVSPSMRGRVAWERLKSPERGVGISVWEALLWAASHGGRPWMSPVSGSKSGGRPPPEVCSEIGAQASDLDDIRRRLLEFDMKKPMWASQDAPDRLPDKSSRPQH